MRFRPCIDIHNGKVKQIVGESLLDKEDRAKENFVSEKDAAFYAKLYQKDNLKGGHIILLNAKDSPYYKIDCKQAQEALKAYPKGMQIGGGITNENAKEFLEMGASHVIVTSYVFQNGQIQYKNLEKLVKEVRKEHLVLDLSCRKRGEFYYIMTDRWKRYTQVYLTEETLTNLSSYCDEFLIHAVDVEGHSCGIEKELVSLLGNWGKIPITYAGGVNSLEDLEYINESGKGKLDVTIGSALDLFGGVMKYKEVVEKYSN